MLKGFENQEKNNIYPDPTDVTMGPKAFRKTIAAGQHCP